VTKERPGPRGGETTSLPSGLLRKTVYVYREEWEAIEKEAIRRGNLSARSEIVREAIRAYLGIES
jgi:ribbon-helix-helix CopG family protein